MLSLLRARCVCRRFEAIATPAAYRTVTLNEALVASPASQRGGHRYRRALENVSAHANHVVVRSNLDRSGVRRILGAIRQLVTVRQVPYKYSTVAPVLLLVAMCLAANSGMQVDICAPRQRAAVVVAG